MAVRYVSKGSSACIFTTSRATCKDLELCKMQKTFRPQVPSDAPIQQGSNLDSAAVQTSPPPSLLLASKSQTRSSTSFNNKRAVTGCGPVGQYARGTMGCPSGQGIGFRCSCCLPDRERKVFWVDKNSNRYQFHDTSVLIKEFQFCRQSFKV